MKAVTKVITKDSDRVRKIEIVRDLKDEMYRRKRWLSGFIVQFQQKKVLVEPGEGYFNQR